MESSVSFPSGNHDNMEVNSIDLNEIWRGICFISFCRDTRLDHLDRVIFIYLLYLDIHKQPMSQAEISRWSSVGIGHIKEHLEHLQESGYINFSFGQNKVTGRYMTLVQVVRQ